MIKYEVGFWGVLFVFKVKGSVFPKATVWALPSAAVALFLHYHREDIYHATENAVDWVQIWANYNFVLGFLLIFRTTEAYRRYWEGGTLMQQVRGEWYNAASSLVAFCSADHEHKVQVEEFQHCLVRLISMLYCAALQQVSEKRGGLRVLDYSGLNRDSIDYLARKPEKCEIILQWVQRLIVDSMRKGIIDVEAPIVSRVFQELSRGIVNMNNARKITDFLFPFPYAQMITFMLMCNTLVIPWVCIMLLPNWWWSVAVTFLTTLMFWSVHYIAIELEMPFGDDLNDLPLQDMQKGLNESLWTLLDMQTQKPPTFRLMGRHRTFHTYSSTQLGHMTLERHSSDLMDHMELPSEHLQSDGGFFDSKPSYQEDPTVREHSLEEGSRMLSAKDVETEDRMHVRFSDGTQESNGSIGSKRSSSSGSTIPDPTAGSDLGASPKEQEEAKSRTINGLQDPGKATVAPAKPWSFHIDNFPLLSRSKKRFVRERTHGSPLPEVAPPDDVPPLPVFVSHDASRWTSSAPTHEPVTHDASRWSPSSPRHEPVSHDASRRTPSSPPHTLVSRNNPSSTPAAFRHELVLESTLMERPASPACQGDSDSGPDDPDLCEI